jgi:hypothetical protein
VIFKLVVEAHLQGATPEDIAERIYPSLELADVYGAIAYYLRHKDDVQEYMRRWDEEGEKLRREIEAKQPPNAELKARLLARKAEMEKNGTWGARHDPVPQ